MIRRALCSCLCFLLAACEARVNVELGAADLDGASAVLVALDGVDLLDEGGDLHTLSGGSNDAVDLRTLVNGSTQLLIDSAEVDVDRYTGLRLRFADSGHSVELDDGTQATLTIESAASFADIDVKVDEGETATVLSTLDLRFSLQRESASGAYTLIQVLRAIDTGSATSLSGTLDADAVESEVCRQGRVAAAGVAVYLFDRDADALVDYRRGLSGPIASARVQPSGTSYFYDLPNLAPGDYTLAWTCEADVDAPDTDDDVSFQSSTQLTLSAGEAGIHDF